MRVQIIWDLDDDPRGNVRHISIDEHLSKEDVQCAVDNAIVRGESRSSGELILFGPSEDGRLLAVVYEEIGEDAIYPITAFFVED
jgi:uncharacterized DUF497 family protein